MATISISTRSTCRPSAKELRQEVRAFLRQEIEAGTFSPHRGKGAVRARPSPARSAPRAGSA